MTVPSLHWFRSDLRLADNPALAAAASAGPALLLYILDDSPARRALGGASRWWLAQSLRALAQDIADRGGALLILRGDPEELLPKIVVDAKIGLVTWSRRYDAAGIALDTRLKAVLSESGCTVTTCNAALLNEPWQVASKVGEPMKVFTPYWRAARARGEPEAPRPAPKTFAPAPIPAWLTDAALSVEELELEPTRPDWAGGLRDAWTPGEQGAKDRLIAFLEGPLEGYGEGRNRPDYVSTSRLSPHLSFGEIGPRQIWHATRSAIEAGEITGQAADAEKFLSEIGWREFSYHLLFYNPDLATQNYNRRFDDFPWKRDEAALAAWRRGATGYPIVDAGMRELWTTGWMHNRVRMIVASFLIKHLLIDWREGESWFWDTLVDADPANNAASWQWVAGSGADAAPYYRIFNPVTQGKKFDPEGLYVRRWIPEIAGLGDDLIHEPWTASATERRHAGLKDYPQPLVALDAGRERALAALASLKPV